MKQTEQWTTTEDPRMLREQIRVADVAFNHLHQESVKLTAENQLLRDALQMLYDETADYIRVNHLGDVHHNQAMKLARFALRRR